MSEALIRAERICLDVPIYLQRERSASGWAKMLLGAAFDSPQRRMIRLLHDIDLDLREGDRLAILGRNGAGKSTLLRVLNEVYTPTSGRLTVRGSCQALLNMALGFNPEATVRENIFLRGIAMGLSSSYLRQRVGEILEFSGLEDKVTHRLRTLSSGQKMRLGFAISTCEQNDIILMDEWVGAGDAEFMLKARERMQSRVGGSKILVLASHSIGLLRSVCNKGIVLEQGRLVHSGDIQSALTAYHELLAQLRARHEIPRAAADAAGGAQVYGCAETITMEKGGTCTVKGWIVDAEGRVPRVLAMEANGERHLAREVTRHRRPDVAAHLGLVEDECGFHAIFDVPGARKVSDLGEGIQVFGGDDPETADAPLRIAPQFMVQLSGGRPAR